jgi:FixJ family two-component response regulator
VALFSGQLRVAQAYGTEEKGMTADTSSPVLVVDDDPTFRLFAELALQRAGYPVVTHADATAARDCIAQFGAEFFACVLTDYRMPGMDGMALVDWIRRQDPSLTSILITAQGEKRLVQQSMRTGALDFLDKPVGIAELHRAVSAAVAATAQRRKAVRLRREAEEAGRIQKWMVRFAEQTSEIAIDLCFHPKYQAGGDFLVHERLSGNRDVILVTDVAGHSLGAAYLSARFAGFASGLLEEGVSLDQLLERYNRFLLQRGSLDDGVISIAVTALLVDHDLGSMTAYSCGAPAPAWFRASGWLNAIWESRSSPLGWFTDLIPAKARTLIPSGAVWLWTDGLEDLAGDLGASPFSVAHALFEARAGGPEPSWLSEAGDDVLLARIRPKDRSGRAPDQAVEPLLVESYAPEQAVDIDALQTRWDRSLAIAFPQLSRNTRFDVLSCARESVLNALKQGSQQGHRAALQISYVPSEQTLLLRVGDPGGGHQFDVAEQHASVDTLAPAIETAGSLNGTDSIHEFALMA